MSAHLADSAIYGHLWATDEIRVLFTDEGRTQRWLDVLAALAAAQADVGLVPRAAADEIAAGARVEAIDLARVGERTRATGHSTLGLIQVLRESLPEAGGRWVYYGATVQDVTDTWTGLVLQRVIAVADRDLGRVEDGLLDLAEAHRDTVMVGRTHGQPGMPITFGFKAAVWAAEVRRHRERLREAAPRVAVGQLGGAVGTCSFWGSDGLDLQRRFCARLGLAAPEMTWLTARDRVAEALAVLAMATGTLAKIGGEVVDLARPELGEVREAARAGGVGSITMPHKRNPELAEHLGTLSRVVRAGAGLALEGMVHSHERDGAAWKAEWAFLPESCMAAAAALAFGAELVAGLEVDVARMRRNVDDHRGYLASEPVLRALAPRVGKHRAQELLQNAAAAGIAAGVGFGDALRRSPELAEALAGVDVDALLDPLAALGCAGELVDRVVVGGRAARAADGSA